MSTQKHETVFDLDALISEITTSFVNAANQLRDECSTDEWRSKHAYDYSMPRLSASIRLELSHSNGKVKGVFRKEHTQTQDKLASTITVDLVAVPRALESTDESR
jgi:hypothetical protein